MINNNTRFLGVDSSKVNLTEKKDALNNAVTQYYTAEEVSGYLNSYSTQETLTGGTWIDGKPIYRKTKVFSGSELNTSGIIDITPHFININIICPNSSIFTDWQTDNGVKCFGLIINNSATYSIFPDKIIATNLNETPLDISVFDSITLTLEYTKTTD